MIIHTIYRPEECLHYMEDWFKHHIKIGVTHFYIYDNSNGIDLDYNDTRNKQIKDFYTKGKTKYGFVFKYTNEEACSKQIDIIKKYPVTRIKWQRKDKFGNILYNQRQSIHHFSHHIKNDLCAFIDMDEFIIKKEEFDVGYMIQRKFKSIHYYNNVYDCHEYIPINCLNWARKVILDMANFPKFDPLIKNNNIHFAHLNNELKISKNVFNHYNYNNITHKHVLQNIDKYDSNWKYKNEPDWTKCIEYMEDTGLK